MKKKNRIIATILSLMMVLSCIPVMAFAETDEEVSSAAESPKERAQAGQDEFEIIESDSVNQEAKLGIEMDSYELDSYQPGADWGSVVRGTIPANSTVAYKIDDYSYLYEETCHLLVRNDSANPQSTLTITVLDEYENVKSDITPDAACMYEYSECGDTGTSCDLPADNFFSAIYTLSSGDYIVLTAGDTDADFSFRADILDTYNSVYSGGVSSGTLSPGHATLISLGFDEAYERSAVVYSWNNSYNGDRLNTCVLSGNGDLIKDKGGYYWYWLDPGEYVNAGYSLPAGKEYYVLLSPSVDDAEEYDHDYDFEDDFEVGLSPQNIKYYKFYGISNRTYTGKAIKQNISSDYYDLRLYSNEFKATYSNNKNVGTATITITGVAPFTGSVKKTFVINPKGTSLTKVTKARKAFTVKWKKQSAKMSTSRITGYQIQYSTNSKFKSRNKTVTVKGYRKTSKKIKKLKAKKKYYVRIRTYKIVGGKKYYSGWSKVKTVKTK